MKSRTLINSGKKKRKKLTPNQIKWFGTKRQRAALKNAGRPRRTKVRLNRRYSRSSILAVRRARGLKYKKGKVSNPSKILTLTLPTVTNSGKRRKRTKSKGVLTINMAKRRYHRRKRSNLGVAKTRRRYSRRRNPATKVVYRYRKHRAVKRHHRRNPGVTSGFGGKFVGWAGGMATTYFIDKLLPTTLTTGFLGYFTTFLVATFQGKTIGKMLGKPALGKDMVMGGLFYLGLKVVGDMFPSVGAYLPVQLRGGMGIIGPSNFYVPQVNSPGSMGTFVRPSSIPRLVPAPATMRGINTPAPYGHNTRRVGRVS